MLGHVGRVAAVGPAAQVHPALRGHAQRVGGLVAGHDHRTGQVHVHDRHRVLRVRVADHPVLGGRVHQLLGAALDGEPGVGVGGRHLGHGRQQLADGPAVVDGVDAEVGPSGHVPEREGQVGLEHLVGDLGGVERCFERERRGVGVPMAPVRPLPRLLEATPGVEGLGPADDADVEVARQDRRGRVVDQDLWGRAADAGVQAVGRVDAQRLGQSARGIVVLPALAVDDLEAVDPSQHVAARLGIGRRLPHAAFPHGQGLRTGPVLGSGDELGDPDDAGRPGVDAHLPCQLGARFSANALGPSLASSLPNTTLLSSDSIL